MILVNSTILFFPPNYIYTIHICNNIITHKHTRSKSKLKNQSGWARHTFRFSFYQQQEQQKTNYYFF